MLAGGDGKKEAKSNSVTGMTTALELRNPPTMNAESSPTSVPCGVMPSEVWFQVFVKGILVYLLFFLSHFSKLGFLARL